MPQNSKKTVTNSTEKSVKHTIEDKIAAALAEYKEQVGEKKFTEKVEKAAKLFTKSLKKAPTEKKAAPAIKKAVKKADKKSTTATAKTKPAVKKAAAKK